MASIERTAYPRFKRFMSARELHVFYTPRDPFGRRVPHHRRVGRGGLTAEVGDVGVHRAGQGPDDTAEMFCWRVGTLTNRSRDELEALKQHREITERLVLNDRSVLERIDPDGPDAVQEQAALLAARATVLGRGWVCRPVQRHRQGRRAPR